METVWEPGDFWKKISRKIRRQIGLKIKLTLPYLICAHLKGEFPESGQPEIGTSDPGWKSQFKYSY